MSQYRHHPTTAPVARPRTYAETQNAQPFDWWEFLDLADAGKIVRESPEHHTASELAGNWITCAAGNQCHIIPRAGRNNADRWAYGCPLDPELRMKGGQFYSEIRRANWTDARATLRAIEARSAQLIAELSQP